MICLKSCSNAFIQTPGCCLQVGSSFPWENSDIFGEERRKGRKERREGERREGKRREMRGQEGREGRKGKGREREIPFHSFNILLPSPQQKQIGVAFVQSRVGVSGQELTLRDLLRASSPSAGRDQVHPVQWEAPQGPLQSWDPGVAKAFLRGRRSQCPRASWSPASAARGRRLP